MFKQQGQNKSCLSQATSSVVALPSQFHIFVDASVGLWVLNLNYTGSACPFSFVCFAFTENVAQIKTATSSCSALVNLSVLVMAMKASVADPAMARLLVQLHDSLESFKGRRINQLDFIRDVESFVYDRLCLSCWIGNDAKDCPSSLLKRIIRTSNV